MEVEPLPIPAMDDCGDDAVTHLFRSCQKFRQSRRRLKGSFRKLNDAMRKFADVLWPMIEDLPPGFANHLDGDATDE